MFRDTRIISTKDVRKKMPILMLVFLVLQQFLSSPASRKHLSSRMGEFIALTYDEDAPLALPYFHLKPHNRSDALPFHHPRNHPRVGARFQNGSYGYVVDPYLVRRHFLERMMNSSSTPRSFLPLTSEEYEQICNTSVGTGYGEASLNEVRLIRPVQVVPEKKSPSTRVPKILCVVYTHGGVAARTTAIIETWGWRCDGFFAASTITVTDPTQPGFGSVDLDHLFDESYQFMWQKTRSILAYIYEHFLDEFDYFYLCGDDVFLIPENYQHYLSSLEEFLGVTGRSSAMHIGRINLQYGGFVAGAPGYGVSAEALRFYNEESGLINDCMARNAGSAEDCYISQCFESKNVSRINANHLVTGVPLCQRRGPHWIVREVQDRRIKELVPESEVSNETYSWHIMERNTDTHAVTMKRYHAHFYRFCPNDSMRARSMLSEAFLQPNVTVLIEG